MDNTVVIRLIFCWLVELFFYHKIILKTKMLQNASFWVRNRDVREQNNHSLAAQNESETSVGFHSSDMMQGCVMIIEKFRAHESNSERSDIGDASISQTSCLQESLFL